MNSNLYMLYALLLDTEITDFLKILGQDQITHDMEPAIFNLINKVKLAHNIPEEYVHNYKSIYKTRYRLRYPTSSECLISKPDKQVLLNKLKLVRNQVS